MEAIEEQKIPLQARLGQLRAYLFRFRTLDLAGRLFGSAPHPLVLGRPFCGYRLLVDVSRSNAQRLLFLEGERFLAERFLLRRLLRPGMRVVDVGANIGYYLLFLARAVGSEGALCCLEPEPENLAELERNLRHNRIGNARILPFAAGSEDSEVSLHPGINGKVADDGSGSLTVPLRRLDSVLDGPVELIKIDVEGYEGHVLAGAERLLREHHPVLFIEVHPAFLAPPTSLDEIFDRLATHYAGVQAYTHSAPGRFLEKLVTRYWLGAGVARVKDLPGFLAACREGLWTEPFWVVCDTRKPERFQSSPCGS
jgi:FkbM family methyltransferase